MTDTITLYGLKNCDTCKKAIKTLQQANYEISFVDIRTQADLAKKIPYWLTVIKPEYLINTRSTTWRKLEDHERERANTEPEQLLIGYPTLIKRPVIDDKKEIFVGWTRSVQARFKLDYR